MQDYEITFVLVKIRSYNVPEINVPMVRMSWLECTLVHDVPDPLPFKKCLERPWVRCFTYQFRETCSVRNSAGNPTHTYALLKETAS